MSSSIGSAYACGLLILGEGEHKKCDSDSKAYFNYHQSEISLLHQNDATMPCHICFYSPFKDVPLPEGTVVGYHAKFSVNSDGIIYFDAMSSYAAS